MPKQKSKKGPSNNKKRSSGRFRFINKFGSRGIALVVFAGVFAAFGVYTLRQSNALTPVPVNGSPAHRGLGVYPSYGDSKGVAKLASIENFLGRKLGFVDANIDHRSESAFGGSSWGQFEQAGSFKVRPDVKVAITIPLRLDETGARTTKAGGPALIRSELQATANGAHDARYILAANRMIANGHADAILRIGHEPDIPWYPWSFINGNEDVYKQAFRRVVNVFRSVPGQKFLFDYNTDGDSTVSYTTREGTVTTRAEAAYPGNDVVDIVGIDVYNGSSWDNTKKKLDLALDIAKRNNKQLSIPEWGLRIGNTGDDPTFIQNMYNWMQATPASGGGKLLYHVYFWGFSDSDLDKAPKSKAKFKELFGAGNITTPPVVTPPTPTPPPAPTPPPNPNPSPALPNVIIEPGSVKAVPANPKEGDQVIFKATIKNIGAGATPNNVIHGVSFWIGKNTVTWSDNTLNSLAPGASRELTANSGMENKAYWVATLGSHQLTAKWDDVLRITESDESNNVVSTTITVDKSGPTPDTTPPARPAKPKVTLVTQTQVAITWDSVNDNVGVTGYYVYRNNVKIATTTTRSFVDTNLQSGASYSYQIKAFDAAGNESPIGEVLGVTTTQPVAAPPPASVPTPPNTDKPIQITPDGQNEAITIAPEDTPIVGGSVKLTNPSSSSDGTTKTTLKLNNSVIRSTDGNEVDIDTTTLANGTYALTLESTDDSGETTTTSRILVVNNDLSMYEKVRNFLFRSLGGKYSGRTMNIILGSSSLLLLLSLIAVVLVIMRQHRNGMMRF